MGRHSIIAIYVHVLQQKLIGPKTILIENNFRLAKGMQWRYMYAHESRKHTQSVLYSERL